MQPQKAQRLQKKIWQSFSPDKKITIIGQWSQLTRQAVEASIRRQHRGLSNDKIKQKVNERLYQDAR